MIVFQMTDISLEELLRQIRTELKITNTHLAITTDTVIEENDIFVKEED